MISYIIRSFGFLLLMIFVAWILYVFWLGLKQFFTPKASKKSSKYNAILSRPTESK